MQRFDFVVGFPCVARMNLMAFNPTPFNPAAFASGALQKLLSSAEL